MKSTPLLLLGVVLTTVGATRLSMHMGLAGLSTVWVWMLAVGIIMICREPVRQLTERVRVLEEQLGSKASSTDKVPAI